MGYRSLHDIRGCVFTIRLVSRPSKAKDDRMSEEHKPISRFLSYDDRVADPTRRSAASGLYCSSYFYMAPKVPRQNDRFPLSPPVTSLKAILAKPDPMEAKPAVTLYPAPRPSR